MNPRALRSAVRRLDTDKYIFMRRFGVFDYNVKIAVVCENAGVEEFEFRVVAAAATPSSS